jgi:hypothetical protein
VLSWYRIKRAELFDKYGWLLLSRPPLIWNWLDQFCGRRWNNASNGHNWYSAMLVELMSFFVNRYYLTLRRLVKKTGKNLYGQVMVSSYGGE